MPVRALAAIVLGLLLVAGAVGCSSIEVELQAAQPRAGSGTLSAGAARRDITPIPGYPMGGHSFAGEHAIGNLGRLYARAIYLEDAQGQPVVLVAADLWAISIGLRDRVVEIVQREHGLSHLGREHVVIAATHTHQSPAAHASNHAHNLAGGKIWAFDPALFEFVAHGIAMAVVEAHASREPARLSLRRAVVADFARNRSLEPFEHNPEADAIVAANATLPACTLSPLTRDPKSCRAVDPGVGVLIVEADPARADVPPGATGRRMIASGVFLAAHATAMPNSTVFYQGDVLGLAAVELERQLADVGTPVVAVFNGPEGDVSPTWARQGWRDTLRLAEGIARGLAPSFREWRDAESRSPSEVSPFRVRHGLFALTGQRFLDDQGKERFTPRRAMVGTSVLGGAEDGKTVFAHTNREGRRRARVRSHTRAHGHGVKQRSMFQASAAQLPPEVPLSVIDLGAVIVVSLPGEVTTVQGRRIRAGVAEAAGRPPEAVLLAGLANEYRSYFTTPQEYELQHYEGGSTLYGAFSGLLLDARLRCLAGDAADCAAIDEPLTREHEPGPRTRTGFREHPRSERWLARIRARIDHSVGTAELARPTLRFSDSPPRWPAPVAAGPRARVEVADGCRWRTLEVAGAPQSDDHYRVLTIVTALDDRARGPWSWEAIWLDPVLGVDQRVRLRAVGVDGIARCSPVFDRAAVAASQDDMLRLADVGCAPPPGCG